MQPCTHRKVRNKQHFDHLTAIESLIKDLQNKGVSS